jgi:hypothetical protein
MFLPRLYPPLWTIPLPYIFTLLALSTVQYDCLKSKKAGSGACLRFCLTSDATVSALFPCSLFFLILHVLMFFSLCFTMFHYYLVDLLLLLTNGSCKKKNTPSISIDSDSAALEFELIWWAFGLEVFGGVMCFCIFTLPSTLFDLHVGHSVWLFRISLAVCTCTWSVIWRVQSSARWSCFKLCVNISKKNIIFVTAYYQQESLELVYLTGSWDSWHGSWNGLIYYWPETLYCKDLAFSMTFQHLIQHGREPETRCGIRWFEAATDPMSNFRPAESWNLIKSNILAAFLPESLGTFLGPGFLSLRLYALKLPRTTSIYHRFTTYLLLS